MHAYPCPVFGGSCRARQRLLPSHPTQEQQAVGYLVLQVARHVFTRPRDRSGGNSAEAIGSHQFDPIHESSAGTQNNITHFQSEVPMIAAMLRIFRSSSDL